MTFSYPREPQPGRKTPADFDRESFGKLLEEVYAKVYPDMRILYYAVFKEQHKKGSDAAQRIHYHASLKTGKQHKWARLAAELRSRGVFCSFSCREGGGYSSAFRYGYCPTARKPISELDPQPCGGT